MISLTIDLADDFAGIKLEEAQNTTYKIQVKSM